MVNPKAIVYTGELLYNASFQFSKIDVLEIERDAFIEFGVETKKFLEFLKN